MEKEKPILYCNTDQESKEAYSTALKSEIPFEYRLGVEDVPPPWVLDGYVHHIGILEINEFIKNYEERENN